MFKTVTVNNFHKKVCRFTTFSKNAQHVILKKSFFKISNYKVQFLSYFKNYDCRKFAEPLFLSKTFSS